MNTFVQWIIARLEEKSTWLSIITILAVNLGHQFAPNLISDVATTLADFIGTAVAAATTKTIPNVAQIVTDVTDVTQIVTDATTPVANTTTQK